MWLIIGSVAAKYWYNDFRDAADIDLLTPAEIKCSTPSKCFVETHWLGGIGEEIIEHNSNKTFADPQVLLTLKASHAHWDIKWDKTMFDISFLTSRNVSINLPLYHKLYAHWQTVHGKKRANLKQTVEEFFNDGVHRTYDHEALHELVAFSGRPMHEQVRPDPTTVWIPESAWDALTDEQRVWMVLEECMVTAIERFHLTEKSRDSEITAAMAKAYKLLCTSMTKGYFALYLILNRTNILLAEKYRWHPHIRKALSLLSSVAPAKTSPKGF